MLNFFKEAKKKQESLRLLAHATTEAAAALPAETKVNLNGPRTPKRAHTRNSTTPGAPARERRELRANTAARHHLNF